MNYLATLAIGKPAKIKSEERNDFSIEFFVSNKFLESAKKRFYLPAAAERHPLFTQKSFTILKIGKKWENFKVPPGAIDNNA
jgi:hypothetical protein